MKKHTIFIAWLSLAALSQSLLSPAYAALDAPVKLIGSGGSDGEIYAIGTLGMPVLGGGLDQGGAAYASNLLGSSLNYNGMTFTFDTPFGASSSLFTLLPTGQYSSLTLLGSAVRANQPNQTFIVTYTDGTTNTFTQSMSNINTPQNYPGESLAKTMAYRLNADGSEHPGAYSLYAYTFALDPTKTVKALTLPDNFYRTAFLAANLTERTAPQVTAVKLIGSGGSDGEIFAIGTLGMPVLGGGLDQGGAAYASNLLGSSLNYNGMTFTFDTPFGASSSLFTLLPTGQYSSLTLLGSAVRANQPNQTFIVTYTDGTTNTFTQSMSNINTPQNYPGESLAKTMAYRLNADGSEHPGAYSLYAYTFALDPTKTVKALTLPDNFYRTAFLAANLTERTAPQVTAVKLIGSGGSDGEIYAIGTLGMPVLGGGLDQGGAAYASNLLGSSLNYNGITFTFDTPFGASSSLFTLLPTGQYSSLTLLGSAVRANQPNQTFIVTYTDGTTNTFTQSMSNINTPQNYPGESLAKTMAYRLNADGSEHPGAYSLYAYTFALDPTKTVKALTLPNNVYGTDFLAANLTAASRLP